MYTLFRALAVGLSRAENKCLKRICTPSAMNGKEQKKHQTQEDIYKLAKTIELELQEMLFPQYSCMHIKACT